MILLTDIYLSATSRVKMSRGHVYESQQREMAQLRAQNQEVMKVTGSGIQPPTTCICFHFLLMSILGVAM